MRRRPPAIPVINARNFHSEAKKPTGADSPAAAVENAGSAYTAAAYAVCKNLMRRYSTSFSLASRLLPSETAYHISAIYALARISDEIVDGAWPGSTPEQRREELTHTEARVQAGITNGYSSDVVIHAFAQTVNRCGIPAHLWQAFFDSMRLDTEYTHHSEASFSRYIYGSAEVIGHMCIYSFFAPKGIPAHHYEELMAGGSALGAALQKVNFLRDLGEDTELGRRYFPDVHTKVLTEAQKQAWHDDIAEDLTRAGHTIALLPPRVQPAVWTAHGVFARLNARIAKTPADSLAQYRVRVPAREKLGVAICGFFRAGRGGS